MRLLFFISVLGLLTGCGESPKETKGSDNEITLTPIVSEKSYPEALNKVFEAHGGLNKWKKQQTLSFRMPKDEETSETHTIDLYSRKDRVEGPSYSLGYDGEQVWLADKASSFESDPVFYHNLMFYFYAMPFVLADDGIVYRTVDDLVFEGKNYPGIRISYKSGVGSSPKDEYYLYYEPDTHIVAWLGYTVTYFSDAPSDDLHWIRYDNWMDVNGLLLPGSMTWYNYEGRTIKDAGDTASFNNVMLSEDPMPEGYYDMPPDARPAKGSS
jgi:hypothetical protein